MSPHDQTTVSSLLQAGEHQLEDKVEAFNKGCGDANDEEVVVLDIVQVLLMANIAFLPRDWWFPDDSISTVLIQADSPSHLDLTVEHIASYSVVQVAPAPAPAPAPA